MTKVPKIIINYKTYEQSTGSKALKLSQYAQEVTDETGIEIAIAPQAVNLAQICEAVDVPVYAQHIDPITPGGHTTFLLQYFPPVILISSFLFNINSQHIVLCAD